MDERRRRILRRSLVGGVVFRDPARFWHCLLRRPVLAIPSWDMLKGVDSSSRRSIYLLVGGQGSSLGCRLSARSGPRRPMLHCNHRCGVGRRRKTALAATAMRDDSACSGLRRLVFSLAEHVWCGTTSYDGTGDNLDVLFEGSGSCGGKQRGVSDVRRRPGCLVRCFGGGASCSLSCRQHKERVRSLEWWRMWRGPCAREEASNGG